MLVARTGRRIEKVGLIYAAVTIVGAVVLEAWALSGGGIDGGVYWPIALNAAPQYVVLSLACRASSTAQRPVLRATDGVIRAARASLILAMGQIVACIVWLFAVSRMWGGANQQLLHALMMAIAALELLCGIVMFVGLGVGWSRVFRRSS